jgi:hypothetical protein
MMKRECGACQACCSLLPVKEIGKKTGERCQHQKYGVGCKIHEKRFFYPNSCRVWNCAWLGDPDTAKLSRPDRSHYVVDIMPDFIVLGDDPVNGQKVQAVQVWVDPAYPHAHRDPALREFLLKIATEHGAVAVIRYNSTESIVLVAPPMAENGQWTEIPSKPMDVPTAMRAARTARKPQEEPNAVE